METGRRGARKRERSESISVFLWDLTECRIARWTPVVFPLRARAAGYSLLRLLLDSPGCLVDTYADTVLVPHTHAATHTHPNMHQNSQ